MNNLGLPKLEGLLQRLIRHAAEGHGFLAVCMALSTGGTLTALYPVTAVVVPASLLVPRRWPAITAATALGSAVGATLLVAALHQIGWAEIHARFPELATNDRWTQISAWVAAYGPVALFLIAASPLPQTPALIFFAIAHHDYPAVFAAILAGKTIKYGLFAWLASHFPERFRNGFAGLFRRRANQEQRRD